MISLKLFPSLMIFTLLCASLGRMPLSARAQTGGSPGYKAELIVKKGAQADKKSVVISHENGNLKINSPKGSGVSKSIALSSIKSADYSYSEKPQIKEALISSFLFSNFMLGLAFLFTKTKKHWLVLSTEEETLLLELRNDNYRRLLFELNVRGVPVEDLGDRDRRERTLQPPSDFVEGETCGEAP